MNENLIILEKLLTWAVCGKNKETTVHLSTLFTPWFPEEAKNDQMLEKWLASSTELSSQWSVRKKNIVVSKRSTGQRLCVTYQELGWQDTYYTIQANKKKLLRSYSGFDSDSD